MIHHTCIYSFMYFQIRKFSFKNSCVTAAQYTADLQCPYRKQSLLRKRCVPNGGTKENGEREETSNISSLHVYRNN